MSASPWPHLAYGSRAVKPTGRGGASNSTAQPFVHSQTNSYLYEVDRRDRRRARFTRQEADIELEALCQSRTVIFIELVLLCSIITGRKPVRLLEMSAAYLSSPTATGPSLPP